MTAMHNLPFEAPAGIQQLLAGPMGGVTCFFSRIPAGRLPMQAQFHGMGFGLSFLISGHGTLADRDGVRHAVAPGSFFRFFDGHRTMMHYESAGDFCECCLYLQPMIASHLAALGCVGPRPLVSMAADPTAVVREFHALHRLLRPGSAGNAAVIAAVAALLELATQVGRGVAGEKGLDQVLLLLGQDLERRPSLLAIAAQCGLSYRSMYTSFRRHYGLTPGNYRIRCRLQEARRLLERLSVQQTAQRLGYPDPFTFSKQFRRHFGLSPTRYQATGEPMLGALGAP